jgi:hypothetical protein
VPEPQHNALVDLNNARNLPRERRAVPLTSQFGPDLAKMFPEEVAQAIASRPGAVLDRPQGELKLLWLLYAQLLEREAHARRQSDRKQRRKAHV